MANLKAELVGQLGLMGGAKFGYVGDWKGALILVREETKGATKPLIITIAIKSLLPKVPSMPETFELAQGEGLLTVEKRNNMIRIEIPDPEEIDAEPLVQALKEYHQVLSDANCLPDVKCSECMNRQGLEVVARDDRAIRICPDCVKRLPANEVGSGTVVMEIPPKAGARGAVPPPRARASDVQDDGHSLGPSRQRGGSSGGISPMGCATLPLTILIAGILYGATWYGCLEALAKLGEVNVRLATIVIAAVVLIPTCLPLIFHLRASRLAESINPVLTNWFFVLLTAAIGECVQVMFFAHFTLGLSPMEVALSPLALVEFWSDFEWILVGVKVVVVIIGIWAVTTMVGESDEAEDY